ncbi:hypothetical protein PG984_014479 [Apiospora sp. TS-2023a]
MPISTSESDLLSSRRTVQQPQPSVSPSQVMKEQHNVRIMRKMPMTKNIVMKRTARRACSMVYVVATGRFLGGK